MDLMSPAPRAAAAPRVILVTGTSSGFGRAIAQALHARGDTVFGTSRRPAGSEAPFPQLALDVGDEASVQAAVQAVLERAGRLDAVVNNAGGGLAGAIEDTSVAEAQAQLDTNFFGVHRVVRAVLPHFRARGQGRVVTLGSLGGLVPIPFQAFYCASKFALEAYCQALRIEVKPFGVQVCLVEPGDFATGFTGHRRLAAAAARADGPYAQRLERALAVMVRDEQSNPEVAPVVRAVLRALDAPRPPLRLPVATLTQRILVALEPFLPDAWVEWALEKTYQVG
jgi:NAD(P)-dependent dehydrogenase (short-subunit alcohol dehydrogenase family)